MTRIDFHSNVPDKISYACRLARKARKADFRIVLLTQDRAQMTRLDEMMWTFSENDFLPHVALDDALASQTPILLTADPAAEVPHHDILINLSDTLHDQFSHFTRIFEIISMCSTDRYSGRERYTYYKQRGYRLTHFVADNT